MRKVEREYALLSYSFLCRICADKKKISIYTRKIQHECLYISICNFHVPQFRAVVTAYKQT
jgi:hypothetical protein